MAFDIANFAKISSGYAHIVSPQMFSYLSVVDPIESLFLEGYFNDVNREDEIIRVGDIILMEPVGSNATFGSVTQLNPITVGPFVPEQGLGANSVATAAIQDGAVTRPKLSAGLDYGFRTVDAKSFSTVGGSPTENFVFTGVIVAGALAGDEFIIATMLQAPDLPTADARIRAAEIIADNSIQVQFSIDPSNIHIIQFIHLRRTDVIPP